MISFLRQNVAAATLLLLAAELSWLMIAAIGAIVLLQRIPIPEPIHAAPAFVYAFLIVIFNIGFGVYRRKEKLARSSYFTRVCMASAVGTMLAYIIADWLPGGEMFRQNVGAAALLAVAGQMMLRHAVMLPLLDALLPHRLLVLGTGAQARQVEASLDEGNAGVKLIGFFALDSGEETAVTPRLVLGKGESLAHAVRRHGVDEIVVAVRQQRGGVLPLRELLACRLAGVKVTDLAGFFERVHGHVPLDMSRASWFIYGDGYRQNWLRRFVKRSFDLVVVALLVTAALPLIIITALLIALEGPGTVIYRQQRIGRGSKTFTLFKFRSMAMDAEKDGKAAWAAVNDMRVTRVGRFIRRTRIDELPQLINVLRGEMSLVGPRPERPEFVTMLSEQIPFYAVRHSVKPGITGWAQVRHCYVATVDDTVKKLEYDIYYVKNNSLLLDLLILLETVRVVLLGEGAR
ncbi:MAG: TIGR03013 family XrtA/PEP-CTERM system glycosyltransferase [Casimicrobiaceae bacterium]